MRIIKGTSGGSTISSSGSQSIGGILQTPQQFRQGLQGSNTSSGANLDTLLGGSNTSNSVAGSSYGGSATQGADYSGYSGYSTTGGY